MYSDTREALLRPKLVRKADEDIEWNWARPKFFARSLNEDLKTKRLLYANGFATAEDPEFVGRCHGKAVGNGYFGVVKGDCKDVVDSANEMRKLRGTCVLVPSNSLQESVPGDTLALPNPMQWNHMHLESLEMVVVTTQDRISYFNIFRMPEIWRGGFALTGDLQGDQLPGCTRTGEVVLCSMTPSMGWKSAVGLTHEVHRSI